MRLMPADIQVNSVQCYSVMSRSPKMASENTVFYEKFAEAVLNYPCCYDKSSDDFTNRTSFCLHVLVLVAVVFFVCGAAIAAVEFRPLPPF